MNWTLNLETFFKSEKDYEWNCACPIILPPFEMLTPETAILSARWMAIVRILVD